MPSFGNIVYIKQRVDGLGLGRSPYGVYYGPATDGRHAIQMLPVARHHHTGRLMPVFGIGGRLEIDYLDLVDPLPIVLLASDEFGPYSKKQAGKEVSQVAAAEIVRANNLSVHETSPSSAKQAIADPHPVVQLVSNGIGPHSKKRARKEGPQVAAAEILRTNGVYAETSYDRYYCLMSSERDLYIAKLNVDPQDGTDGIHTHLLNTDPAYMALIRGETLVEIEFTNFVRRTFAALGIKHLYGVMGPYIPELLYQIAPNEFIKKVLDLLYDEELPRPMRILLNKRLCDDNITDKGGYERVAKIVVEELQKYRSKSTKVKGLLDHWIELIQTLDQPAESPTTDPDAAWNKTALEELCEECDKIFPIAVPHK